MSARTPSVSILVAVHLVVYGSVYLMSSFQLCYFALLFAPLLIWASTIDVQRFEIPDTASILILALGCLWLALFRRPFMVEYFLTAIAVAGIFFAMGEYCYRRFGIDGLGMGDAKLIGGLALWLGLNGTILVILISSISAIVTILASRGKPRRLEGIAFGPFLCLSAWAVWLAQG